MLDRAEATHAALRSFSATVVWSSFSPGFGRPLVAGHAVMAFQQPDLKSWREGTGPDAVQVTESANRAEVSGPQVAGWHQTVAMPQGRNQSGWSVVEAAPDVQDVRPLWPRDGFLPPAEPGDPFVGSDIVRLQMGPPGRLDGVATDNLVAWTGRAMGMSRCQVTLAFGRNDHLVRRIYWQAGDEGGRSFMLSVSNIKANTLLPPDTFRFRMPPDPVRPAAWQALQAADARLEKARTISATFEMDSSDIGSSDRADVSVLVERPNRFAITVRHRNGEVSRTVCDGTHTFFTTTNCSAYVRLGAAGRLMDTEKVLQGDLEPAVDEALWLFGSTTPFALDMLRCDFLVVNLGPGRPTQPVTAAGRWCVQSGVAREVSLLMGKTDYLFRELTMKAPDPQGATSIYIRFGKIVLNSPILASAFKFQPRPGTQPVDAIFPATIWPRSLRFGVPGPDRTP